MYFHIVEFCARNKLLFFIWTLISLYLVHITMVYLKTNANEKNRLQFPIRPNVSQTSLYETSYNAVF